jgi:hypothetical protein
MAAARDAKATAKRAARSDLLERLIRFGLIAYGVVHLLVGWLAVQIAFGRAPEEGDQAGAFKTLAGQPIGRVLLVTVVIGLAAMVVWQVLAAAFGYREQRGGRRTLERVGAGCRAGLYAVLAWQAATIVAGSRRSAAEQQQAATSTLLASGGGRWLVGVVGLAIAGLGVGLTVFGVARYFENQLNTGQMSATVRRTTRWLGTVGYVAKGVAYAVVGLLVLLASVRYDPSRSRGLDQALRTLASRPLGVVVLLMVALGFAAFGVFCLFQARYRKV